MNNPSIYFIGLLTIVTVASLILINAQENNNVTLNNAIRNNTTPIKIASNLLDFNKTFVDEAKPEDIGAIANVSVNVSTNLDKVTVQENVTLSNTTQNNTTTNITSLDLTALNKAVNTSKPEKGNKFSTNASASFYTPILASNGTVFPVGGNKKAGEQAFEIGMPIKPAKDASQLGYIIQATPHGTV
jgi:hypothetical protein